MSSLEEIQKEYEALTKLSANNLDLSTIDKEFQEMIEEDLSELKESDESSDVSYSTEGLSLEEITFIEQQTVKHELKFSIFEAVPGKKIISIRHK